MANRLWRRMCLRSPCCVAIACVAACTLVARAERVTYQFSTTVQSINPAVPGFPASLSGVSVGAPISGTICYERSSPFVTNTLSGPYGLATRYTLHYEGVSFTIGGVLVNSWAGTPTAFVWNNDQTTGVGPLYDGVLFQNFASPAKAFVYKVGNIMLPTNTFAVELLPWLSVPGSFQMSLQVGTGLTPVFLTSNVWSGMTRIPPCPGDIVPGCGNRVVDVGDLLAVINAWGPCTGTLIPPCPPSCPADISPFHSENCSVDVSDLLAVINAWGPCP